MRRLKWILVFAILATGLWYFFLKDHHYQVSFRSDQPASLVFNHILDWENYDRDDLQLKTLSKKSYSEIIQEVGVGDSLFTYQWRIEKRHPKGTKVTAYITDENDNFIQKIKVPFGNNDFVKRSLRNTETVAKALQLNSETYKVHSIKDSTIAAIYCAYLPLSSRVEAKASTMLSGINEIMDYVKGNDLSLNGDPFLEVTHWDENAGVIDFNFCFPLKKRDSMPTHPTVRLKTTEPVNGIKAEFNGNYRISNKAWYYLLEHAEKFERVVQKLPLEIYLNDPHSGGDPLLWKALIFLPLDE
ncbi:hypothetical protein J1N09_02410 [Aureitalea sp. L0-47]|nr:hypothetical protein [Aureitalea sp. L0-47]